MRRVSTLSLFSVVALGTALAASIAGCTINPVSDASPDGGAAANGAPGDDGTGDPAAEGNANDGKSPSGAQGGGDGGAAGGGGVDFKPSNVPIDTIDASKVGDVAITGSCTISSEEPSPGCMGAGAAFTLFTQSDASRVGMYVVKSFRVEANAILDVRGTLPIVIVALDKMEILGAIRVNAAGQSGAPGGFIADVSNAKGGGPGGGGAGSSTNGGGGGGFCGAGGIGDATDKGTPASGGKAYGTPELSPLVGGSAGGSGAWKGGAGGGAIQLVAGSSFLLSSTGVVFAGGGGGDPGNANASGGGSGGGILIEADSATILGTLSANGGGGGAGVGVTGYASTDGHDATPDDVAAPGGVSSDGTAKGGTGSAGDTANGADASHTDARASGSGGGGGAGRIRINTKSGAATLSGTISPSAKSGCFTQGPLTH